MTISYYQSEKLALKAIEEILRYFSNAMLRPVKVKVANPREASSRYGMIYHKGTEPYKTTSPYVPANRPVWIVSDVDGHIPTHWDGTPLIGIEEIL